MNDLILVRFSYNYYNIVPIPHASMTTWFAFLFEVRKMLVYDWCVLGNEAERLPFSFLKVCSFFRLES